MLDEQPGMEAAPQEFPRLTSAEIRQVNQRVELQTRIQEGFRGLYLSDNLPPVGVWTNGPISLRQN